MSARWRLHDFILKTFTALKYFCINHGDHKVFFNIEIIINVLRFFRFIWIPMLWVYGHYKLLILSVRGPSFSCDKWRQVRFWRPKTFPALKGLTTVITFNYLHDTLIFLIVKPLESCIALFPQLQSWEVSEYCIRRFLYIMPISRKKEARTSRLFMPYSYCTIILYRAHYHRLPCTVQALNNLERSMCTCQCQTFDITDMIHVMSMPILLIWYMSCQCPLD